MPSAEACPFCAEGLEPLEGLPSRRCKSCGLLVRREDAPEKCVDADPASEEAKAQIYDDGLKALERETAGRRVLDIGCGFGTFLERASSRGWTAAGVEVAPGPASAARARGFEVHAGPLASMPACEPFDAACFWDSLEVREDLAAALAEAKDRLKPGGWVLVRARNAPVHLFLARLSFLRLWLREPATFHRHSLGRTSLELAFRKAGLEPVEVRNSALSTGDPYGSGIGSGASLLGSAKLLYYGAARLVQALSGGRLLWSTSVLALARKPLAAPEVLHVITRLDPGGSSESTWAQIQDWKEPGTVQALAAGLGRGLPPSGVTPLRWLVRNPSWRDLPALVELYRLFKRRRPAIVHLHSSKAGLLGRIAARAAGLRRVVYTPHGHVFYGYFGLARSLFYQCLEELFVPWTRAFVGLTEGEKREWVERGLGRKERWYVAPSGTPLPALAPADKAELRRRLGLDPGVFWAGSLMRLERVKGPDLLLEAASYLKRDAHLHYILLGEGPMRAELEKAIRSEGLEGRFILSGQKDDIWPWLQALDLYVQPSRNEAMGRGLVQAQHAGLAVVATRACGIPDVVREGSTAVLVDREDPRALAEAIAALAASPERREKMGERARAWVASSDENGKRRFSPEAQQSALSRMYAEILNER